MLDLMLGLVSLVIFFSIPFLFISLLGSLIRQYHKITKSKEDYKKWEQKIKLTETKSNIQNKDVDVYSFGTIHDSTINPSSGLPMTNGVGSVDVGGNTYGN